jgi:predicted ATPase
MSTEIKNTAAAGLRAKKSLRYKEARMHYENIIRYLEGNSEDKMYVEAQEALKELDKDENRMR